MIAPKILPRLALVLASAALVAGSTCRADDSWIVLEGGDGPGHGKHVVLVSGDEEYRSEEALPQLAKILAKRHGFKCTVLFAIGEDGSIDPDRNDNIPGLEALESADLMILATRFRNLKDEQMARILAFAEAGKPIIGMRTATHAFNIPGGRKFAKYSWNSRDPQGGFGRVVLGETWISHHGNHGSQSTRGILAKDEKDHPILRGLKDGDIWGPTDVYGVRLPLPGDSKPLVYGEVVEGMKSDDPPAKGPKNDPMMPVAWIKSYQLSPEAKAGKAFTTTMGAATDLENAGLRRLLVNATYWAVGLEDQIKPDANVDLVGEYKPRKFGFKGAAKGVRPEAMAKP